MSTPGNAPDQPPTIPPSPAGPPVAGPPVAGPPVAGPPVRDTPAGEAPAGGAPADGTWTRRAARLVLRRAVRGRTGRGSDWGEAMLAELEETGGGLESVRWALGGALVSWWRRGVGRSPLPVPPGNRGLRRELRLAVLTVVAVVVGTALLRSVVSVAYIPSASMEPTLRIGDRYLVDRLGFQGDLHHGDVVLVRQESHDVVKRVLGVAGDAIDCTAGTVRRNGQPVDEPYLPAGAHTDCSAVTVPTGSLYVLGDHRAVSLDSRTLGTVATDSVSGRVLTRIWPLTH